MIVKILHSTAFITVEFSFGLVCFDVCFEIAASRELLATNSTLVSCIKDGSSSCFWATLINFYFSCLSTLRIIPCCTDFWRCFSCSCRCRCCHNRWTNICTCNISCARGRACFRFSIFGRCSRFGALHRRCTFSRLWSFWHRCRYNLRCGWRLWWWLHNDRLFNHRHWSAAFRNSLRRGLYDWHIFSIFRFRHCRFNGFLYYFRCWWHNNDWFWDWNRMLW